MMITHIGDWLRLASFMVSSWAFTQEEKAFFCTCHLDVTLLYLAERATLFEEKSFPRQSDSSLLCKSDLKKKC